MEKIKQRFSRIFSNDGHVEMEYLNKPDGIAKEVNLSSLKTELNDLLGHEPLQPYHLVQRLDSLTFNKKHKVNTKRILDDMSHIESSAYSSVVSIPEKYIKQKRSEKWKKSYILRKMAGIPFAVLHGLILYVLLRYIIYPSRWNEDVFAASLNQSINTNKIHNRYLHGDHLSEHLYASAIFSVTVGFVSIFSRGTRCTLLLILPCVITGRSRAILFTFITGILVDGPISNLVHNYNEIRRSTLCTYKSLVNYTKESIHELSYKTFKPNLSFPKISAINDQLSNIHDEMTKGLEYLSMARKALTVISMVLLIINAVHYLRSYYSDNSFDNVYISRNVRRAWKVKCHDDILPLRRWEINKGYQVSSSAKITKRELAKIYRKLLPTFLFTIFCIFAMIGDTLLAGVLYSTANKKNIEFSSDGRKSLFQMMMTILMNTFNESVRACESRPRETPNSCYILISSLLVIPALSCVFEVYFSRIRAVLCNFFYTERAQERADYLHYRISVGRINRRIHSKLSIRRALERQNRLKDFSPWLKLKDRCGLIWKTPNTFICPGCEWKVKCSEAEEMIFTIGDITIQNRICNHCSENL